MIKTKIVLAAERLTGRPAYDPKSMISDQERAAIRVLIRALDGGTVTEDELTLARWMLK
jgi:hypothetical protein